MDEGAPARALGSDLQCGRPAITVKPGASLSFSVDGWTDRRIDRRPDRVVGERGGGSTVGHGAASERVRPHGGAVRCRRYGTVRYYLHATCGVRPDRVARRRSACGVAGRDSKQLRPTDRSFLPSFLPSSLPTPSDSSSAVADPTTMANRQLLARATEGTSAPTPGYLYNDLSQAAQSSPTAASEMVDYLVHRLQSTHNVHTKAKCLTVVSKLCDSSLSFKRTLAQKPPCVQAIKDGLRHAGPPDPVCGDAYHQKVRAAAQAAVDAVYRADPAPATLGGGTVAPHYASPPGSSMGMTSSRPRMEGLGNPRYKDPRLEPAPPSTIQEVAREAGDVILGMIKDPLARNHHVGRHGNLPGSNKYATGHHGGYGPSSHGRVGELYSGSQGGVSCVCACVRVTVSSTPPSVSHSIVRSVVTVLGLLLGQPLWSAPRSGSVGAADGWTVDHGLQSRSQRRSRSHRTGTGSLLPAAVRRGRHLPDPTRWSRWLLGSRGTLHTEHYHPSHGWTRLAGCGHCGDSTGIRWNLREKLDSRTVSTGWNEGGAATG